MNRIKITNLSEAFISYFPPRETRGLRIQSRIILKSLNQDQCRIIAAELKRKVISQPDIARYLGVNLDIIKRLAKNLLQGKSYSNRRGRPKLIGIRQQQQIRDIVIRKKAGRNSLNTSEVRELFLEKWKETSIERGGNGLECEKGISRSTINRYHNSIRLKAEFGQKTTEARKMAAMDVRNFVSAAVMHAACSQNHSWHCIGNMDATQFLLQYSSQLKLVSAKAIGPGSSEEEKQPTTRTEADTLDLFIKQYFLASAAGFLAPPLFLIADNAMNADDFILVEVPGLGFSFDNNPMGYIAFCQTRVGNLKLNEWIYTKYIPQFARTCCAKAHWSGTFYLVIDGESSQLQPLDLNSVIDVLKQNKIDLGKGPASCSGVCGNALDCGNLFKAAKTRLKRKKGVGQGEELNSELIDLIVGLLVNKNHNLTADKRNKIAQGVVHLLYHELDVLTIDLVKDGFRRIGMIGPDPISKLRKTLSCCPNFVSIPYQQVQLITNKFSELVHRFQAEGELSDQFMDEVGIMQQNNNNNRESLVIHRQRAVLLTKEAALVRRRSYLAGIAQKAAAAEEKKQEREIKAQEKKEYKRKREYDRADRERTKRYDAYLKMMNEGHVYPIKIGILRRDDGKIDKCTVIENNNTD